MFLDKAKQRRGQRKNMCKNDIYYTTVGRECFRNEILLDVGLVFFVFFWHHEKLRLILQHARLDFPALLWCGRPPPRHDQAHLKGLEIHEL